MSGTSVDDLARMDESGVTREHWKIMFISGMGFFTDAYDLFIIGVAMHLIKEEWQTSPLTAELDAAIASVLGLVVTLAMLPETKGRSLEELSAEPEAAPA